MVLEHVVTNASPTALRERPDDPLLVLLHGAGSDETSFDPFLPHVAAGVFVVAPRSPLTVAGRAVWYPSEESADAAAPEAGLEVLDWLRTRRFLTAGRPVLALGVSQGGRLATDWAARGALDLARLGVVSASPHDAPGTRRRGALETEVFWWYDPEDPALHRHGIDEARRRLRSLGPLQERHLDDAGHVPTAAHWRGIALDFLS
jgi:predicted esterase